MRFLLKRLVTTVVTLLMVTLVVFILSRLSGDPRLLLLAEDASREQWEQLGRDLGLDKPVAQQYLIYVGRLLRGDLGRSTLQRRPVSEMLWARIPNSAQLAAGAFAFSLVVGIPLGVLAAVKRGGLWDYGARAFAIIGVAMPVFWVGLVLIFIFGVQLEWVPTSRKEGWTSFILPSVALGWAVAAGQVRILRSSLLDVLDAEYVKLARAKGVSKHLVIWKHAVRNALIAPLTYAGLTLAGLVTGSIIVETVFAWPGLGLLAIQAVNNSDYAVLQGVILLVTVVYVLTNLLVDVLYVYVDPRIRYG